jgi:hypothetical protein
MRIWLLVFLALLVLTVAPIARRVSSWGDPICRHGYCPSGYEMQRHLHRTCGAPQVQV